MIFNKHVRALASAALLAISIGSVAVGIADAKTYTTKASCEAAGFKWSETLQACNDQLCWRSGLLYGPGDLIRDGDAVLACDGTTGEWVRLRTANPQGPTAPQSTTTGTAAPPSQVPANPLTAPTTGTYSQPTQPTPVPVVPRTTGTYSQR